MTAARILGVTITALPLLGVLALAIHTAARHLRKPQ